MLETNQKIVHELKILDRCLLSLNGVNKIISFDNSEFILESNLGPVHICGENLELLSLNLEENTIKIKGKINGFNYIEKTKKKTDESFISKLFK